MISCDQPDRIQPHFTDQEILDPRREEPLHRWMQTGDVDVTSRFERCDRGLGLLKQRPIGRVGSQLLTPNGAQRASRLRYEDEAAQAVRDLTSCERDQSALAVTKRPDAWRVGLAPDDL